MQVIRSENVIYVDVDDTLVTYPNGIGWVEEECITLVDPYDGNTTLRLPHLPNIKLVKNHKARGAHIIVWSQNGFQWAEAVVKALGLQPYIDLIQSKPRMYIDDLPCQEWMGERMYLDPNHAFGRE
jgi:hypothetical protein